MQFYRTIQRKISRHKLKQAYEAGRQADHPPGFFDRTMHFEQHRAIRSAFMRGYTAKQATLNTTSPFAIPASGPHMDVPNSEWDR